MALNTTNGAAILRPEEVNALLVQPVQTGSVAVQVSTLASTGSNAYRIPVVETDPVAAFVDEGDEITPSDAVLDEANVVPSKVAGLTIVSRELSEDTSPEAAAAVGAGLARDIATRIDEAYFGDMAAPAPAGLGSITANSFNTGGTEWADVDPFVEAIFEAENVGANLTAFVANPADALALSQLKESTDSNKPLLQPDATLPTKRAIQGVPLYVSPHVTAGVVWGVPQARVHVVVRTDARIEADKSVYFTSDRVAVKGTMRVGFGFAHEAAVQKINLAA
ncbi:MAG: phage major capsid protein [Propionibacteriales bacterium]|nr:phage major capsid protein [Propionibacteriales bacterium]